MRCGSLVHVVPCWGYCFREKIADEAAVGNGVKPKKVAVFGDTCDSS